MDSLLRWGIENSSPPVAGAPPPVRRTDLDSGIIDHILGKPDAVLMKEALAVAVDDTQSEDDRVRALDNLEMVRSIFLRCAPMPVLSKVLPPVCREYR